MVVGSEQRASRKGPPRRTRRRCETRGTMAATPFGVGMGSGMEMCAMHAHTSAHTHTVPLCLWGALLDLSGVIVQRCLRGFQGVEV